MRKSHNSCIKRNLHNVSKRKITIYYFISTTKWTAINKNWVFLFESRQHEIQMSNKSTEWVFKKTTTSSSTAMLNLFFLFGNRELKCAHKANMCFTYSHHQQIPHLVWTGFCLRLKLSIRQSNCFGFQSSICATNLMCVHVSSTIADF